MTAPGTDHEQDAGPEQDPEQDALITVERVQELTFADLANLLGDDALRQIGDLLGQVIDHRDPYRPRPGSQRYQEMLLKGANEPEIVKSADLGKYLQHNYGWRGLVDFMVVLVASIQARAPEDMRDSFGRVVLDRIINQAPTEDDVLSMAIAAQSQPQFAGVENPFGLAMDYGMQLRENTLDLVNTFQRAVDQHATANENGLRTVLFTVPGIRDEDSNAPIEATVILATANSMLMRRAHRAHTRPQPRRRRKRG
jgi:hypothetical protein